MIMYNVHDAEPPEIRQAKKPKTSVLESTQENVAPKNNQECIAFVWVNAQDTDNASFVGREICRDLAETAGVSDRVTSLELSGQFVAVSLYPEVCNRRHA